MYIATRKEIPPVSSTQYVAVPPIALNAQCYLLMHPFSYLGNPPVHCWCPLQSPSLHIENDRPNPPMPFALNDPSLQTELNFLKASILAQPLPYLPAPSHPREPSSAQSSPSLWPVPGRQPFASSSLENAARVLSATPYDLARLLEPHPCQPGNKAGEDGNENKNKNKNELKALERRRKIQRYKDKAKHWRETHAISRSYPGRRQSAMRKPRINGQFAKGSGTTPH